MTDSTTKNKHEAKKKANELPPAPEGFSFKQGTMRINDETVDTIEVKWTDAEGNSHSASFRKKVLLGQRIRAMEAFGEAVTAEGRVGFLAAICVEEIDHESFSDEEKSSKEGIIRILDLLDDVGLMAWMRAKAEIAKSSDEQAEAAKVKATVGN